MCFNFEERIGVPLLGVTLILKFFFFLGTRGRKSEKRLDGWKETLMSSRGYDLRERAVLLYSYFVLYFMSLVLLNYQSIKLRRRIASLQNRSVKIATLDKLMREFL